MRPTRHTGVLEVIAYCDQCDRNWESKNAMGIAARHAETYGHTVRVEQTIVVIYNKPKD